MAAREVLPDRRWWWQIVGVGADVVCVRAREETTWAAEGRCPSGDACESGETARVVSERSLTSADLLFRALQSRRALEDAPDAILDRVLPVERARPLVTVVDGHPHTLSFLAEVNLVPAAHLGVTRFGQSGSLDEVYRYHGIDADSIIGSGFDLLDLDDDDDVVVAAEDPVAAASAVAPASRPGPITLAAP